MVDLATMTENAEVERPWDCGEVEGLCPPVVTACRDWKAEQVGVQFLFYDPT